MKGKEGSQVVVGVDNTHFFPLAWTDNPVTIVGYNYN